MIVWRRFPPRVRRPPSFSDDWKPAFRPRAEKEGDSRAGAVHPSRSSLAAVLKGEFCFLNQKRNLGFPPRWQEDIRPPVPRLWRFQLQYHDIVRRLAESNDSSHTNAAWLFVASWLDAFPAESRRQAVDAWHPYCIARRIPNWVRLRLRSTTPSYLQRRFLRSLWQQADFLARTLEWDLRGNHLLEDLRGLAWATAFFGKDASPGWRRLLERHVPAQLEEQVLPHGEHIERSTMYHAAMLDAVLDMAELLPDLLPAVAETCRTTAARMAEFLDALLLPDGEIPLLGDSCFGEAPPARVVLRRAASLSPFSRAVDRTGPPSSIGPYFIHREGDDMLLFDAGPAACDWLPAHGHADLFHVEVAVAGKRVFTDSGVFDYDDSPERAYCRSTAAHNTLEIDGQNQCDVYSRFRMGRRGRPGRLVTGTYAEFHWATCSHDAYRFLGVPSVRRYVLCRAGGPWILFDRLDTNTRGTHRLCSRLHLHPAVEPKEVSPDRVTLEIGGRTVLVTALGPCRIEMTESTYHPEFGVCLPRPCITLHAMSPPARMIGFAIHRGPPVDVSLDQATSRLRVGKIDIDPSDLA
ncbi:hypothetical protein JCM19992_17530 [Thermostilla marina]